MIGGMDEAGRGPAIGPLVFGLVLLTDAQETKLKEAGVNDSKQLSAKKREEYREIIVNTASAFDTLVLDAAIIDEQREGMTLNQIEVNYFRKLLAPFSSQVDRLELDAADVNAERFGSQFSDMIEGSIDSRHKGDSIFVSVGAASILAKTRRDQVIEELQEKMIEFDPDLPSFGSGYPSHAKPFLEAYVKKYRQLPDIARKSWKTSKDAYDAYGPKQLSLDDYF